MKCDVFDLDKNIFIDKIRLHVRTPQLFSFIKCNYWFSNESGQLIKLRRKCIYQIISFLPKENGHNIIFVKQAKFNEVLQVIDKRLKDAKIKEHVANVVQ